MRNKSLSIATKSMKNDKLKEFLVTLSQIGIALFLCGVLVTGCVRFLIWVYEPSEFDLRIEQEIGGTLRATGVYNQNLHDWSYNAELYYRAEEDGEEYYIGRSYLTARVLNKNKQIIKKEDTYLVSAGEYRDDKIFASRNLVDWSAFKFSKESVFKIDHPDHQYVDPNSASAISGMVLNPGLTLAFWERRFLKGSEYITQKLSFTFYLDWNTNQIIGNEIINTENVTAE